MPRIRERLDEIFGIARDPTARAPRPDHRRGRRVDRTRSGASEPRQAAGAPSCGRQLASASFRRTRRFRSRTRRFSEISACTASTRATGTRSSISPAPSGRTAFSRPIRGCRTAPCWSAWTRPAKPLLERLEVEVTIDHDLVAGISARSSLVDDRQEVEVHDLEFGLRVEPMDDGRVRLRSNVVSAEIRDSGGWRLVPGELVAIHHKELLRSPNRPPRLQHDERMYYEPCGWCGRNASQIALEGCDECSSGPTPAQLRQNREQHARAIAALETARAELTAQAAEAEAASRSSRARSAVAPKPLRSQRWRPCGRHRRLRHVRPAGVGPEPGFSAGLRNSSRVSVPNFVDSVGVPRREEPDRPQPCIVSSAPVLRERL